MRKSDLAYVIGCAFLSIFSLAYCATLWFHLKLPRYYPLEHTWKMVKEPGVPSQGGYGMVAFAFLTSLVITSLLYVAIRSLRSAERGLTPFFAKVIGGISILVLLGCMVYLALHEFMKWGIL
jgi:hypothetical protein